MFRTYFFFRYELVEREAKRKSQDKVGDDVITVVSSSSGPVPSEEGAGI